MLTIVALVIAIVMQFFGAILALGLVKRTKYSLSWILISIGFLIIAIQRSFEFIPFVWKEFEKDISFINTWLGIITSILFTVGILLIRKIFIYLRGVEKTRNETEKRVLNAVIQTEESERRRFAKDLHDGLGPLLSTVKMAISSLSQDEESKNKKNIIENTDLVINEAIKSLKEISNNISPHVLDNFGLASAIKFFVNKISGTSNILIGFDCNIDNQRFDYNTEVIMYRVVCELINNTLKHANASEITIQLMLHKKHITLMYTDNGKGFDVSKILDGGNNGMGYSNIHTRIKSIKGSLNVESENNKGTKVVIVINV